MMRCGRDGKDNESWRLIVEVNREGGLLYTRRREGLMEDTQNSILKVCCEHSKLESPYTRT
jgi:hypothetical protein